MSEKKRKPRKPRDRYFRGLEFCCFGPPHNERSCMLTNGYLGGAPIYSTDEARGLAKKLIEFADWKDGQDD